MRYQDKIIAEFVKNVENNGSEEKLQRGSLDGRERKQFRQHEILCTQNWSRQAF